MKEYIIALDVMGGDNAPEALIEGAKAALQEMPDIKLVLCGKEEVISGLESDRVRLVPASEVITMEEAPMMAVRKKVDSSLVKAMLEVREGRADAVVSAGSTGAVLAGGMFRIGRIKGIERPALAGILPARKGPTLLTDIGANVDCQPKYLNAFAMMGSVYMENVVGIKNPKVGLANIGTEAEKGNKLAKESYELMSTQKGYNFCGNVEAREISSGEYQVVVFDGFDGNLILKYTEGLSSDLVGMLKEEIMGGGLKAKIGGLLLKPAMRAFKKRMDYTEQGGAPLLGVDSAVVKAHGSSNAKAICSAIRQARSMLENDVVGKIRAGVAELTEDNKEE